MKRLNLKRNIYMTGRDQSFKTTMQRSTSSWQKGDKIVLPYSKEDEDFFYVAAKDIVADRYKTDDSMDKVVRLLDCDTFLPVHSIVTWKKEFTAGNMLFDLVHDDINRIIRLGEVLKLDDNDEKNLELIAIRAISAAKWIKEYVEGFDINKYILHMYHRQIRNAVVDCLFSEEISSDELIEIVKRSIEQNAKECH